jgi:hypothetical protein
MFFTFGLKDITRAAAAAAAASKVLSRCAHAHGSGGKGREMFVKMR